MQKKELPRGGSLIFHIRTDMDKNDEPMRVHNDKPWHIDYNMSNPKGPLYLFECDHALRHRKMSVNFLSREALELENIEDAELVYNTGDSMNTEFGEDSVIMFRTELKQGIEGAENFIEAGIKSHRPQKFHATSRMGMILAEMRLGQIIRERHPTAYETFIKDLRTGDRV